MDLVVFGGFIVILVYVLIVICICMCLDFVCGRGV